MTDMIRIFDKDLRYTGICDDYSYLKYKNTLFSVGTLTIRTVFSEEAYGLFLENEYLCTADGQCFAIDAVYSDGEEITVRGSDLLSLLDRCVLRETATYNMGVGALLCELAASGAAYLPCPLVCEVPTEETPIAYDSEPGSLYRALKDVCAAFSYGMRLRLDLTGKRLIFTPFAPTDRTASQRERTPLILGRRRENLAEEYYAYDRSSYKNGVVVEGTDGDGNAVLEEILPENGEAPRLLYYRASGIKPASYESEEAWRAALRRAGEKLLATYTPDITYTAVLNPRAGETVTPGDKATFCALGGAVVFDAVVTECETVYDRGNVSLTLIAGSVIPTVPEIVGRAR